MFERPPMATGESRPPASMPPWPPTSRHLHQYSAIPPNVRQRPLPRLPNDHQSVKIQAIGTDATSLAALTPPSPAISRCGAISRRSMAYKRATWTRRRLRRRRSASLKGETAEMQRRLEMTTWDDRTDQWGIQIGRDGRRLSIDQYLPVKHHHSDTR
jgi:hypothetical protein